MPDPDTPWPKGMQSRKRTLTWGNVTKEFEIHHSLETWVSAVQLPITVVVGEADIERLSNQPQQGGWTRLDRAQHYINQMQEFAVTIYVHSFNSLKYPMWVILISAYRILYTSTTRNQQTII